MKKRRTVLFAIVAVLTCGSLGWGKIEVKGAPIVLTPEDFKPSYIEAPSNPSTETESKSIENQYKESETTTEEYPTETSTEATTEKEENTQNEKTEEVTKKLDLNDVSRVQIFAPAWLCEITPNEEDNSILEKYPIDKKEVDSEKLKTIKSFVSIFFNIDSRNFVDSSQIDEILKKLKEVYSGKDISSELKSKLESKLVCVVSEPLIYGEDSNNNVYISLKRYIPTESKEKKYGRYIIKFNFNENKISSYEILKEIYDLPVLNDTSDILKNGEFPMSISELGIGHIRDLNSAASKCDFKGQNINDSNIISRVIKFVNNNYSVRTGFNYKMYYDEYQIERTASEIEKFGYNIDEACDFVKNNLNINRYVVTSVGITSKDYMFYSSEDNSTIVVYTLVVIYYPDDNWVTLKYSSRVDEIKIKINPESAYGFEIESAEIKIFRM